MSSDLLVELLQTLDAPQARYAELARYHAGEQGIAFISPESRKALGTNRLTRMVVNVPRLQIASIVERLRLVGFSDPRAWTLFVDNDFDQLAPQVMTDALLYGCGWCLVWSKDGKPVVSVESPRQCAVLRAPEDRSVIAGVKRYNAKDGTHAYVYLPDRIEHWHHPSPDGTAAGMSLIGTVTNTLGMVPLIPFENGDSEITDVLPLTDALSKLLLDMMIASEAAGKPRRWIAGLELTERVRTDPATGAPVLDENDEPIIDLVSPIDDLNTVQTAISESPDTKFGTWPGMDLSGFKEGVQVLLSAISAVTAIPAHMLDPLSANQAPSADGLRASESALTAKAESKQLLYGRAFEQVGRLLLAVESGADPTRIPMRVRWADASTKSTAQEMDAAQKAMTSKLLSRRTILARLGMSDDEIEREIQEIERDAAAARDIAIGAWAG